MNKKLCFTLVVIALTILSACASQEEYQVSSISYEKDEINIIYPKVSGLQDAQKQKRINDMLKKAVFADAEEFKGNILTLDVAYKIMNQNDNYIGIQYLGSGVIGDGLRYVFPVYDTVNVDMSDGSRIRLQDMVRIDDRFVKAFKQALHELKEKDPDWAALYAYDLQQDNDFYLGLFMNADREFASCFSYMTKEQLMILCPREKMDYYTVAIDLKAIEMCLRKKVYQLQGIKDLPASESNDVSAANNTSTEDIFWIVSKNVTK